MFFSFLFFFYHHFLKSTTYCKIINFCFFFQKTCVHIILNWLWRTVPTGGWHCFEVLLGMHNQFYVGIKWLCITLAWIVCLKKEGRERTAFLGLLLGLCAVPAAGKRMTAFSACCQPLSRITLMFFFPSLFPACNEINAALICITLLLRPGLQNECGIV